MKIDVDGESIEYVLSGDSQPVIVLLNGHNSPFTFWKALFPAIEQYGCVLRYNRLNIGNSDRATTPQDGQKVVQRLRRLLLQLELQPPYLIVAHSLGGLYANLFARYHPNEVAGVLFVEAGHPDEVAADRKQKEGIAGLIENLLSRFSGSFKEDETSEYNGAVVTVEQIQQAGPFPEIPLAVVTGAQKMPFVPRKMFDLHQEKQRELLTLSPNAIHLVAQKSGHMPQMTEPEVVLNALEELITLVAE